MPGPSRRENWNPAEPAVFIPTTRPWLSTSGPPESPGWMSASVWSRPDKRSLVPPNSSLAVIVWLRPVIEPSALEGVPPTPPAFPIPVTESPTRSDEESPSLAVVRPEASESLRTATSCDGS